MPWWTGPQHKMFAHLLHWHQQFAHIFRPGPLDNGGPYITGLGRSGTERYRGPVRTNRLTGHRLDQPSLAATEWITIKGGRSP